MIKSTLREDNHIEDFNNVVELLGPPEDIEKVGSKKKCKGVKVGIIGGGLSGLAAAFELRKLGFDITIFETNKERIGGRVYTHYFDKKKKLYGELGAMRIPVSHETTWHYINLFNLNTRPFIEFNENAFLYVRNIRVRNDFKGKNVMEKIYPEFNLNSWEKNIPWNELIDYALGGQLIKLSPQIRREILEAKREYSKEIEGLGSLSIREVMEQMKLSEGAIQLISCINTVLSYFYYSSYIENLQEEYVANYEFRYEVVGGMSNLPLAFYNSLMNKSPKEYSNIKDEYIGKVCWKGGHTVVSIEKCNKKKVNIKYCNEKSSESISDKFDYVICTIPFSSLRNININPMFSTEKMQAIKELVYISAQKTILLCRECFWEKGNSDEIIIGGASNTDLLIGSIWYPNYKNNYNKKEEVYKRKGVLLASYNMNEDAIRLGNMEPRSRIIKVKRDVEAVHGLTNNYLDSIVEDHKTINWDNEKGFYGGFSNFMPSGQKLFAYSSSVSEYDNRVYFAGEHTSLTHGWMQGALNSAMKVANDIAKHCK
ncbi:MAG: flavin monoamine oxidase family protein [Clostridium sp.]|uniref:flavin monoamine oxidase family protein n=1 Tax=Clostridium sp. TaxID=1506 RepID=UPI003F383510